MIILEQLMQRSQFTMIVLALFLVITGIPKTKGRYRAVVTVFTLLSIGAGLQWYATYIVGLQYFREEAHWPYLILAAAFVIAAGALILEVVALRLFRRLSRTKKEPNQALQPTAAAGRG